MKKIMLLLSLLTFCACSDASTPEIEAMAKDAAKIEHSEKSTDKKVSTFESPRGVTELCEALTKIPGGDYSKKDRETENIFCSVDFYANDVALCPKTWSTSPGTIVLALGASSYNQASYEKTSYCGDPGNTKGTNVKKVAKFKQTMNAKGTSGTFSQSSLMYYHFGRYFDTKARVPVSVYREMDRSIHRKRVSSRGYSKSKGSMIKAGWKHMLAAEREPKTYSKPDDIFTQDRSKIYGIMIRGKGARYGMQFNGTRVSGWGKGQNYDFQETPGFQALRKRGNLSQAIEYGIVRAKQQKKMRPFLKGLDGIQGEQQVALWMRELIELTLMDYIFSQQDRVGNLDFRWYWAYAEDGEVKYDRESRNKYEKLSRTKISQIPVPEELQGKKPQFLCREHVWNDNDAGGRVAYANFAKSTSMLENLEHYSAKLYNKLMDLDDDLQGQGPIYQWLKANMRLTTRRFNQVISNTHKAANLLRAQCKDLRFDLDDIENYMVLGDRTESVNCQ